MRASSSLFSVRGSRARRLRTRRASPPPRSSGGCAFRGRLVVGQRPPGRSRPQRASVGDRPGRPRASRGDRSEPAKPVRGSRARARAALRWRDSGRAGAARPPGRARASPGRSPERDRRDRRAASRGGRVRRGRLPSAPGRPRHPDREQRSRSSAGAEGWAASRIGFAPRLRRSLAPGVSGERRAVIAAVVLGEDEGLSPDLRDQFRASGLYHLLAVSGQNVAYVVAGMLALAWLLGVSRWIGEIGALVAVGGYLMAVGWQPSVVRAGVAGGLASLAWLAGRARDRWYFLLVGAAVLLAWNPYSLLEPGFQLSFGAVGSIFLLVPRIEAWLTGYPVPQGLATVLAVSIACGGVTAPILMLHFQAAPLFTVASNAVAGPVVAPLLGLALISTALAPVLPEAALALGWVNGWLAAYLAGCARFFGSLPHAQLTSWKSLAALAALALFALVALEAAAPAGRRAAVLVAMLAVVLCRLAPASGPSAAAAPGPQDRDARRRPGRRDPAADESGRRACRRGAARGGCCDPASRARSPSPRRARCHPPAPGPRRRGRRRVDSLPVGFVLDPLEPTDSPDEAALEREARSRSVRIVPARVGELLPARRAAASAFFGPTDRASPARTRTSTASFCSRAMGSSTRSSPETRNRR